MRVPLEWLHEYVVPDLDTAALAERLAMTGTEVERIERHGVAALENFVIGRVLEADVIATATGFNLNVLGDIAFSIDGKPLAGEDMRRATTHSVLAALGDLTPSRWSGHNSRAAGSGPDPGTTDRSVAWCCV